MRHVIIAIVILVLSGVAAVGSNAMRTPPLSWKRDALPPPPPPPPPPPKPTDSSTTQPTPPPPEPVSKPDVATLDMVLKHLQDGTATFVDAREMHEYVEGHFKDAIHLPSSEVFKQIDKVVSMVPIEALVIVYCGGGECEASHNVKDALKRYYDYKNVLIYEKGWAEVMQSGRFSEFVVKEPAP